jgi:hypothetical protein
MLPSVIGEPGGEGMAATNRPGLSRLSGAKHLIGLDLADRFVESKLLSRDDQFAQGRYHSLQLSK